MSLSEDGRRNTSKRSRRSEEEVEGDDAVDDNDSSSSSSSSSILVPRTVMFNFRSLKTAIIPQDGGMTGTLCVPMLQDLTTGGLKFQEGFSCTNCKGKACFNKILFADPDYDVHGDATDANFESIAGVIRRENYEEEFTAHFIRHDINSPIFNVALNYHAQINTIYNEVSASLIRSDEDMVPKTDVEGTQTREYFPFQAHPRCKLEHQKCLDRVNDEWESKNLGTSELFVVYANCSANDNCMTWDECSTDEQFDISHFNTWRADYKIKLYMDISEVIPVDSDASDSTRIGQNNNNNNTADWDALVDLMDARTPQLGLILPSVWAERAVKNYRYFMDLKKKEQDWDSTVYCPSKSIDEVWKAHISIPERYRQDMMAYCGHIIKRSLVLGEEAKIRYTKAYRDHLENMRRRHRNRCKKAEDRRDSWDEKDDDDVSDENDDGDYDEEEDVMDQYYDEDFWPKPRKVLAEYTIGHDGDSDDECEVTE